MSRFRRNTATVPLEDAIPAVPEGWRRCRLGDVASLQAGYAFKSSWFSKTGIRLLRGTNIVPGGTRWVDVVHLPGPDAAGFKKYRLEVGDIVIAMDRPVISSGIKIARLGPSDVPALLLQRVGRLLVSDAVLRDYAYYFLASDGFLSHVGATATGSQLPHISATDIETAPLPLPPLVEQRRIVAQVREAMERVEEIRRLRGATLSEASRVEEAVFADFVEALDGDVPTVSLGEVLSKTQYGTSKKANKDRRGVPCLRMPNIRDGHLVVHDLKHVELATKELDKWTLDVGDVLINRTNSLELVGKAAMFNLDGGPWVSASYLVRLKVDLSRALPEFITAVINSRVGRSYVYRTARRAIGMVNINSKEIRAMPIPLPGIGQQRAVIDRMAIAHRACLGLREQLDRTAVDVLPAAILRKAFAGEL